MFFRCGSNSYPCGWISEWFIITDFPSILNYWPSMTYLLTYLTYIPIYPASHTFKKLVTLVTRIDLTYWIKAGGVFFWIWGMEDCGHLLVHWRWPVFLPVRRLHKRNGAAAARQDLQFLNKRTSFSKERREDPRKPVSSLQLVPTGQLRPNRLRHHNRLHLTIFHQLGIRPIIVTWWQWYIDQSINITPAALIVTMIV